MYLLSQSIKTEAFELIGVRAGSDVGELLLSADTPEQFVEESQSESVLNQCEFLRYIVVEKGKHRPMKVAVTASTVWRVDSIEDSPLQAVTDWLASHDLELCEA
jgi:hypothetical protein